MGQHAYLNIELLNEGDAETLFCTDLLWNGGIYKVTRETANNVQSEKYVNQCGIYFLFGTVNQKPAVYIGQANARKNGNGILGRVLEHKKPSESFWDVAFMVIDKNNTLGATELNYLESKCCKLATAAARYEIVNNCDPAFGNYTPQIAYLMDAYIEKISSLLKLFGYKVFDSVETKQTNDFAPSSSKDPEYYLHREGGEPGRFARGMLRIEDGQYIVMKGSQLCLIPSKSAPNGIKRLREHNKDKINAKGVLLEDISFSSASTASSFVVYASSNGKTDWKTTDGKKLGE